jgi:uncharacterized membrane protein YccC
MLALVVGYVFNRSFFEFAGLGALFLSNTEGYPSSISMVVLLLACVTESLGWVAGTLTSTLGLPVSVLLLGAGLFLLSFETRNEHWRRLGTFTAVTFAVSVGLPGASASHAFLRFDFAFIGALLAAAGAFLHRSLVSKHRSLRVKSPQTTPGPTEGIQVNPKLSAGIWRPVIFGIVCSVGYTLGFVLGLPRDYWVVVTMIIVLRQSRGFALSFTSLLRGCIGGALIAALVILSTGNLDLLLGLLFMFAILMYAVRGVNTGLMQIFLVPFIIILINLIFPGQWQLALDRVVDVAIGGGIALVTAYLLGMRASTTSF